MSSLSLASPANARRRSSVSVTNRSRPPESFTTLKSSVQNSTIFQPDKKKVDSLAEKSVAAINRSNSTSNGRLPVSDSRSLLVSGLKVKSLTGSRTHLASSSGTESVIVSRSHLAAQSSNGSSPGSSAGRLTTSPGPKARPSSTSPIPSSSVTIGQSNISLRSSAIFRGGPVSPKTPSKASFASIGPKTVFSSTAKIGGKVVSLVRGSTQSMGIGEKSAVLEEVGRRETTAIPASGSMPRKGSQTNFSKTRSPTISGPSDTEKAKVRNTAQSTVTTRPKASSTISAQGIQQSPKPRSTTAVPGSSSIRPRGGSSADIGKVTIPMSDVNGRRMPSSAAAGKEADGITSTSHLMKDMKAQLDLQAKQLATIQKEIGKDSKTRLRDDYRHLQILGLEAVHALDKERQQASELSKAMHHMLNQERLNKERVQEMTSHLHVALGMLKD